MTHDVFISQDVMFHEYIFPFRSNSPSTTYSDFFFSNRVLPFHSSIMPPPLDNSTSSFIPHKTHKTPSYLQDYHCYSNSFFFSSTFHPLSKVLIYEKLFPSYYAFVHVVSSHVEPTTYSQAILISKW